ncbi:MAG TPA: hypothetical protein VMF89_30230, partial [Polyangiales bacterium]|nr:hypothetical protein [Polyangiales bacterium]
MEARFQFAATTRASQSTPTTRQARHRPCRSLWRVHAHADRLDGAVQSDGRARARALAFALLASYEGIALLANTFRDRELMIRLAFDALREVLLSFGD